MHLAVLKLSSWPCTQVGFYCILWVSGKMVERWQVILMGDLLCVGREDKPGRGEGAPENVRDQRVSRQEDGRCQVGFCPWNLPSRLLQKCHLFRETFHSHPCPGPGGPAFGAHPGCASYLGYPGDWRNDSLNNAPKPCAIFLKLIFPTHFSKNKNRKKNPQNIKPLL